MSIGPMGEGYCPKCNQRICCMSGSCGCFVEPEAVVKHSVFCSKQCGPADECHICNPSPPKPQEHELSSNGSCNKCGAGWMKVKADPHCKPQEQEAGELKPCPFCGKSEAVCHKENDAVYIVECGFCRSASRRRPTEIMAIKAWNTRS